MNKIPDHIPSFPPNDDDRLMNSLLQKREDLLKAVEKVDAEIIALAQLISLSNC